MLAECVGQCEFGMPHEIVAVDLLGWVENCIKEAISKLCDTIGVQSLSIVKDGMSFGVCTFVLLASLEEPVKRSDRSRPVSRTPAPTYARPKGISTEYLLQPRVVGVAARGHSYSGLPLTVSGCHRAANEKPRRVSSRKSGSRTRLSLAENWAQLTSFRGLGPRGTGTRQKGTSWVALGKIHGFSRSARAYSRNGFAFDGLSQHLWAGTIGICTVNYISQSLATDENRFMP